MEDSVQKITGNISLRDLALAVLFVLFVVKELFPILVRLARDMKGSRNAGTTSSLSKGGSTFALSIDTAGTVQATHETLEQTVAAVQGLSGRVDRLLDQVRDLHSWHDVSGDDGVKSWIIPQELRRQIARIADQAANTELKLSAICRMIEGLPKQCPMAAVRHKDSPNAGG